jgi:hypothetical protein
MLSIARHQSNFVWMKASASTFVICRGRVKKNWAQEIRNVVRIICVFLRAINTKKQMRASEEKKIAKKNLGHEKLSFASIMAKIMFNNRNLTNPVESLNGVIRAATKRRKVLLGQDSARKVIYLAIAQASKKWTIPVQNWRMALSRFMTEFGGRLPGRQ